MRRQDFNFLFLVAPEAVRLTVTVGIGCAAAVGTQDGGRPKLLPEAVGLSDLALLTK